MKKKMYKLLSLILVCTLIMTCNGTVLAANNGNLSENDELISSYIQDIRDNPEMYGYQSKELETLYMGHQYILMPF